MGDLISRSALIESFRKCYVGHVGMENSDNMMTFKSICRIINEQPTAYDVDAVVAELKKEAYQEWCDSPKIVELNDAIDIVRNAGKDGAE